MLSVKLDSLPESPTSLALAVEIPLGDGIVGVMGP